MNKIKNIEQEAQWRWPSLPAVMLLALELFFGPGCTVPRTPETAKPNIIFILTDDQDLARISHDGIILRAASAENTFTSMIRGGSALLSRRQTVNWTPMAAIRLCTSQCPIRRRCYSLVADSADNPQISAA